MRALAIAWIFGIGFVGCSGSKDRAQPATDKSGAPTANGHRRQSVYDLDLDAAVDDRTREIKRDLDERFLDAKIAATVGLPMMPLGAVTVTPSDPAKRAEIEQSIKADYRDTIEPRSCEASARPDAICVQITATYAAAIKKAALGNAVATIRHRLDVLKADASVIERAGQIVLEYSANDDEGMAIRSLIARSGKLELKVVDENSDYMKRVYAHVGSERGTGAATDPQAAADEITAEIDFWRDEDSSNRHQDYYLIAHDREASVSPERARQIGCLPGPVDKGLVRCRVTGRHVIESYLAELAMKDPSFRVPDDRQIAFEHAEPIDTAKDRRPYWRSYYLERAVRLTGSSIANAQGSFDPNTNRPLVLLEFNRAGARIFGDLTAQIVGKKLATILDGRIASAPIINSAIRGGRASITMGGGDPRRQEAERDELVNVLKTGSLPAPLREVSAKDLP